MLRDQLISALKEYKTPYVEEAAFVPRFISLLQNFDRCFLRTLSTGHMTGSAFIVNEAQDSVLLVHHKKLQRWLQPGGHADGDENILNVARREGEEETGLEALKLLQPTIFDVDIHQIPAHGKDRAHFHYDIRYLFVAEDMDSIEKNDESNMIKWVALDNISAYLDQNRSITRMCAKIHTLV